jgi:nitrogen-specific signal transduction histidine kinase/ActR/RegA family two-component response regulator
VASAKAYGELSRELERRVEARTRALAETEAALRRAERLAGIGQLASGVAHEINNPLMVITTNLEVLREIVPPDAIDETAWECVDDSRKAAARVAWIVRQLHLAGQGAVRTDVSTGRVDVGEAAKVAIESAKVADSAAVPIELEVRGPAFARGEGTMLTQVLTNIVVNATHAISDGRADGRVTVRVEKKGDEVHAIVEDNGCGMSEETQRRLFEPFYTTKPVGKGTGLGLAVSSGLVAAMKGEIRVSSCEGEGTLITVILRAVTEDEDAEPPSTRREKPIARRRVLVVDDDADVVRSLERLLTPSYDVETAATVAEALDTLARGPTDAILCDVMMPDGGGERLLSALEAKKSPLASRVVFITGGAVNERARTFAVREGTRVVTKPFLGAELTRAIERALASNA